ncbi:hypothetical protein TNCV_3642371 [Trichonephila clavipes]|nr:hypothetical protein TNCV_3642371 [Trichonephila clavipes]
MRKLHARMPYDYDTVERPSVPEIQFYFCICPVYKRQLLVKNGGASKFIAISGRQGCIIARTVESNQSGRFGSNEFVGDSFRSSAASFQSP